MKKPNIANLLIMYFSGDYGGVEKYLDFFIPSIKDEYNIVLGVVPKAGKYFSPGIKQYDVNIKKWTHLFGFVDFWKIVKTEKINVVISNDLFMSVYVRLLKIFFKEVRHISVIHCNYRCLPFKNKLVKPLLFVLGKMTKKWVHKYVCVSNYIKAQLIGDGIAEDRTEVIYNAVMPGGHKHRPNNSINIEDVAFVGRLSYEKGIDVYLEIADMYSRQYNDVRFHVFGMGRYGDSVKQCTNVVAHGFVKDPLSTCKIDLLIAPSRDEGFPFVAIEAFSAGVPVIASNVGGLKEMILRGDCGILCDSVDKYPDAIRRLKHSKELREGITSNARVFVEKHCNINAIAQKYCDLLEKVLSKI